MSEFHIRSIGAASLALGVAFQFTAFATEWNSTNPTFSLSYSVHPCFVYAAFALQLGLQIWWLLKPSPRTQLTDDDNENRLGTLFTFTDRGSYMPVYTFANNCIILWTIAFQWKLFIPAIVVLSASACMQLYGILTPSVSQDTLTAVVAKLNTAYTILLLMKTWAAYEASFVPPIPQLITHWAIFLLLAVASGPDTVFATALIYVLAALYHGSVLNPLWHNTFYWTAAVIAVVVTIDVLIHDSHDNEELDQPIDFESNLLFSAETAKTPVRDALPNERGVSVMPPCYGVKENQESSGVGGDESSVPPDYFSHAFPV